MTRHYLNATLQCCNGNCSRSGRDHEKENKIDQMQNKEKKVDEIASADELKLKRIEEIKKSLRAMDEDELDEELEKLRAELDKLKEPDEDKKDSKSASRLEHIGYDNHESKHSRYHVLTLNASADSFSGDKLLMKMGSTDGYTKGNSKDDALLISMGSSE